MPYRTSIANVIGELGSDPQVISRHIQRPGASDVARRCNAVIKSFRRFSSLLRLVRSLRFFYPEIEILIADDSFEDPPAESDLPTEVIELKKMKGVFWYQLPFDAGLPYARNFLVEKSRKPFIVNLDDDYVITEETRLENMLRILDADSSVGFVTGLVRHDGRLASNWAGHFRYVNEPSSRCLIVEKLNSPWQETGGIPYRETDLGWNAYAVRREVFLQCPCDEHFKVVGEHLDHFLSMHAQGIRVVYTPTVIFGHLHTRPQGYLPFRKRKGEFFPLMLKKWGLSNPPNHLMYPEPLVPARSVEEMWRRQYDERPNILVLGVGHSGTTILTKMLFELGWNSGPADEEFAEQASIRQLNDGAWKKGEFNRNEARKLLERLPTPWVIKDPRFVNTIGYWRPILEEFRTCLLWVIRDLKKVKESYRKRGEKFPLRGVRSVEETYRLAEQAYREWPWEKQRIGYEELRKAVSLFDVQRSS